MTPPLDAALATHLYVAMLRDVLDATDACTRRLSLAAVLAVHPPEAVGEMAALAPPRFDVVAQRGAGLAARMEWAAAQAAAAGARRVLLRGSDSPALAEERVADALDALERSDVVAVPDRDGGYSLLGLRRPVPGLLDHPMSTATVLRDTLANAERLGLRASVRGESFDLDTAADLRWLAQARARDPQGTSALCGRTLAFLDANDLWCRASSE